MTECIKSITSSEVIAVAEAQVTPAEEAFIIPFGFDEPLAVAKSAPAPFPKARPASFARNASISTPSSASSSELTWTKYAYLKAPK